MPMTQFHRSLGHLRRIHFSQILLHPELRPFDRSYCACCSMTAKMKTRRRDNVLAYDHSAGLRSESLRVRMFVYVLVSLIFLLAIFYYIHHSTHNHHPPLLTAVRPELLSTDSSPPPHQTLGISRAIYHTHLKGVFATSLSADPIHSHFIDEVNTLLDPKLGSEFTDATTSTISTYLAQSPNHPILYDDFVRITTLHVIMVSFFGADAEDLHFEDLFSVTRAIHNLWPIVATDAHPPGRQLIATINSHIGTWLGGYPASDALKIILPAFIPTWQLIAATFSVIGLADVDTHNIRQTLIQFRNNVDQSSTFPIGPNCDTPSVEAIIDEVLRLYPPFRFHSVTSASPHIRCMLPAFIADRLWPPVIQTVDIQEIQRSPAIWGPHAHEFNPMRHHPLVRSTVQTGCLMTFGYGNQCGTARQWMSRAVAIVVGSMLERIGPGLPFEIVRGNNEDQNLEPTWMGWEIVKRPAEE